MMQNVLNRDSKSHTSLDLSAISRWSSMYDLVKPKSYEIETLLNMREEFARIGYVKLDGFLSNKTLEVFKSEMEELELLATHKKFEMPGYLTPRKLSVAGGKLIKSQSPLLYSLYHHYALRACVENIVGRPIYTCTHSEEYMVANFLHNNGDTHGWHLDDPAYALIIFADAPSAGSGGEIEFIPNWTDLCHRKKQNPTEDITNMINWSRENGLIDQHSHKTGDAYLLRADRNLHRVKPLTSQTEKRSAVNLAFQVTPDAVYGESANMLYGTPIS